MATTTTLPRALTPEIIMAFAELRRDARKLNRLCNARLADLEAEQDATGVEDLDADIYERVAAQMQRVEEVQSVASDVLLAEVGR